MSEPATKLQKVRNQIVTKINAETANEKLTNKSPKGIMKSASVSKKLSGVALQQWLISRVITRVVSCR